MVAAVLGTLFGPLVANRYLTIKQLFVVGELAMGVELALVSIFNYLGLESCLLVCIMLFTFTYQSTLCLCLQMLSNVESVSSNIN